MDTQTQRAIERQERPNWEFWNFVQMLPTVCRERFQKELERKIPKHNKYQFKNWKSGKAAIPLPHYKVVNETAGELLKEMLLHFIPHLEDETIVINLFNFEKMEKTTLWFERHKLRLTQDELAEKAGVSSATVRNLENLKPGDGYMITTARKIAAALGKKVSDFKELSED